ncbi:acyl-CoA-like ligand-binding transcription factor [Paractinoplanes rishiriensis]|uniref:TetR family transcriptional regulator n=1 Tax=Paractinoplanes rishiriensis TaxID=1050105 RepID=A0A919MWW3_9ACTN|nr:TetR family transcriptional regulator [Actinoplanes rishiriensis]GIE95075.1 TetR family transcriptional regulator [Actinoplanes rishiriensis]
MTSSLPAGLRERKKAKTRAAIREHAMRLFEDQGYATTTVEQIAEAAEVSPSTFFRYFPTKEDVVLTDDFDPLVIEAIRAQPAGTPPVRALLDGMRAVFDLLTEEAWTAERRRQRLIAAIPELRTRVMQQTAAAIDMLAEVLAEREGRPADDLRCRVIAGAVVGVVLAVAPPANGPSFEPHDLVRVEEALRLVQDNFRLD